MDDKRWMLRHFLAALAYRTQKALRGAPAEFADFAAGNQVRTPHELVRHMTSVLGYAVTFFEGGSYRPDRLDDFDAEIDRFHRKLGVLARHLEDGTPLRGLTPEQLLQGQLADAMTHAGQLAMLRRLAGSPVPPENFIRLLVRVAAERGGSAPGATLTVWVALWEDGLVTPVERGENDGRMLENDRVVRRLVPAVRLAPGAESAAGEVALELADGWRRERLGVVAFLQEPASLAIHAAAGADVPPGTTR